jgi:outer membrane protein assembly factor BamA
VTCFPWIVGARPRRRFFLLFVLLIVCGTRAARAQYVLEDASDKKRYGSNNLVLPYALYTPSERFGGGFIFTTSGLLQPQSDSYGLALGDLNNTYGFEGGTDDLQIKPIDRLFVSTQFGIFRYNFDPLYINGPFRFPHQSAGTNDSSDDNFIERRYNDDWASIELKFLLPIGGGKNTIINHYMLENGMLKSGATGGHGWNPLTTGRTYLTVTPFVEYETVDRRRRDLHFNENGLRFGATYDNADFPLNPSSGNVTKLIVSRDFDLFDSSSQWTNLSAEFTQYIDLGKSRWFRQQVIALDGWTSYSPSWSQTIVGGRRQVTGAPPFYDGATLGGDTHFRGYTENRFWDRAAVYASAELRLVPDWNPLGKIGIFKPADITWMQWVIFGEIGRVGPEYSGNLLSHFKGDAGFGLRILANDTVIRFDVAASNEKFGVWARLNQPF